MSPFDGTGQGDIETDRKQSQCHHNDDNQHIKQHFRAHIKPAVSHATPYQYGQNAADERRYGIEMLITNNHRYVTDEEISNKATGESGEHAEEYGGHA